MIEHAKNIKQLYHDISWQKYRARAYKIAVTFCAINLTPFQKSYLR